MDMKFPSSEPQDMLTAHQLEHPYNLGFVGVGIGKTGATLNSINQLFKKGEAKGVLVLAPMRVANLTWPMEVQRWKDFQWMRVANLRTQGGKRAFLQGLAHIYVCNFEGIPNLLKLIGECEKSGNGIPYDTLVIDESTKIKSPAAKRPNAYRRIVPQDKHKRIWALTGTPAPNSLLDIFAQVRFVDGGKRLGRAFDLFKQTYFRQSGYGGYKWKELPGSQEAIENRIADITLTLRSSDWLDIPDTVVEDIEIPLPTKLHHEYIEFEKDLVYQIKAETEITAANAAALVSKLLQFTSGAIYDSEKAWHEVHDLKLKALEKVIKNANGPVLVACSFKHEQERMRKYFPNAEFFADAKNQTSQKILLERWNSKQIPILVAHPKSVGHGLNLQHGGNTMVWFTLTYSREDYEQMIARLARRGQNEVTYVYRLMVPDTVDFAVATVIEEKRETEDRLLSALQLLESYRLGDKKVLKLKQEEDWI
jgi:SNF2 family DNA or RNA helicase